MQKNLKSVDIWVIYGPERVQIGQDFGGFATFLHLVTPVMAYEPTYTPTNTKYISHDMWEH